MKKGFFQKIIQITLITEMMSPGFLFLEDNAYTFTENKQTQAIKIESFEITDGEEQGEYLYTVRDNRNRLREKAIDPEKARVYTGFKESRLNVITEQVTVKMPDGKERLVVEESYVFELNDKMIEEEASGTTTVEVDPRE